MRADGRLLASRLGAEPDRAMWKKAHKLYVQAFQEPTTDAEKKRLAKLLKKPLPQDVADALFDYEAFLRGLGRMSLSTSPLKSTPSGRRVLSGASQRLQTSKRTVACTFFTRI